MRHDLVRTRLTGKRASETPAISLPANRYKEVRRSRATDAGLSGPVISRFQPYLHVARPSLFPYV